MAGLAADVEAFLGRLVRLDPTALVRVRSAGTGTTLWGRVPWDVLVSRTVAGSCGADRDVVVRARDWLAVASSRDESADVTGLPRLDAQWRSGLPPDEREVVEEIPAAAMRTLGAAAADTLRATEAGGVGGRPVGARAVRDALLDHVAIVVSAGQRRVEIPQRLIQAVVRMGFVAGGDQAAGDQPVRVVRAGAWVGLAAAYGTAWWRRPAGLTVTPSARPSIARP